ncbi:MAG TPA: hypothetical protein VH207_03205, partial [Chthoniobacterales bacterium]|nr:hypothetical protein [Chthoniobacterales bacterium]
MRLVQSVVIVATTDSSGAIDSIQKRISAVVEGHKCLRRDKQQAVISRLINVGANDPIFLSLIPLRSVVEAPGASIGYF